ncbi:MAG: tRNA pseudouridine(13) synthase TruD [Granulosicoccus sp.]
MNSDITDPPAAHGTPLFSAQLKQQAADFCVDEVLDLDFSDTGEHLYLQIEKTAMNTDEVSSVLQACYAVNSADVGLCGLKDRHSVSTQWFSVRTPADSTLFEQSVRQFNESEQAEWGGTNGYVKALKLKQSVRHLRKLKRGAHQCNRFAITLSNVRPHETESQLFRQAVGARIGLIIDHGFPNHIGTQRFGSGAQNLHRARQWFARPRKRCSRQQRSLWLSAARSAVFNTLSAARVRDASWQHLLAGEPAVLDGSRSFFLTASDNENSDASVTGQGASLECRLGSFDIHPSAPWWGRGRSAATGASAEFEALHLQTVADLCDGLERAGLAQERRALRARAEALQYRWVSDDALELTFSLHPGVFATTLLRELADVTEPQR